MKNKKILNIIGNNIQKARLKKGMTQEILAEKCNVSSNYISAIERGVSSGSISIILDICQTLDVTPNYILGESLDLSGKNNFINILDSETSIKYIKLKPENKKFINDTISHLYSMQIKR